MDYPNMRRMMERDRDTDSPLPAECAALLAEVARLREERDELRKRWRIASHDGQFHEVDLMGRALAYDGQWREIVRLRLALGALEIAGRALLDSADDAALAGRFATMAPALSAARAALAGGGKGSHDA